MLPRARDAVSVPSPRPDGRWGGAVTRRPLPASDDELRELSDERRTTLARIWFSQAATEARVARSFDVVHRSLALLGADRGLVATAERAIDDEHRHAALCLDVAGRYANRADLPSIPVLPFEHPAHPEAESDDERRLLFVLGQCAFNETFACAYLSLARDVAESPLAKAATSELLADEIDHSRIGWAYLETAPRPLRDRVARWLPTLAVGNLREWRALEVNRDASLAAFGVPEAAALEHALLEILREVIVPGFARQGITSVELERWMKSGAPT